MTTDPEPSHPDDSPARPRKLVSGGFGFIIASGMGVLGVIVSLLALEQRTMGGILGPGIILFLLTFPVISFINSFSGRKFEKEEAQNQIDQKLRKEAEEERLQLERDQREHEMAGQLRSYLDFGFAHRSIERALVSSQQKDPKTGNLMPITQRIAESLLAEGSPEGVTIQRLLPTVRDRSATNNELFSFGFSTRLIPKLRGMTAEEFIGEMREALLSQLQRLSGKEGDLESSNEEFIRFEVLLIPDIPSEAALCARKSRMRGEQKVHYQIVPVLDNWEEVDSEARPFTFWEQLPKGGWRGTEIRYLYGGENTTITIGPKFKMNERGDRFSSAVVDMWSDKLERGRTLSIDALANDEPLQKELNIRVVRQTEPYSVADVFQWDQKGYVEVVGWFENEEWVAWDGKEADKPKLTSLLNVSAPNLLVLPHSSTFRIESSEQNKLLAEFLGLDLGPRRGAVFSQGGNFEIRRGAVSNDSKIHKYFIRLADNASVTRFHKTAPGATNQYQNFSAYQDFPPPRSGYSPLEDKGFSSVPASDCYFRTGSDTIQLVLKVNLGSPAPGETERGVSFANSQLKAALTNFARRNAISYLDILEEESAQGLVSRGMRKVDGQEEREPVYAKLLDPTHASHFASARLTEKLIEAGIIPTEVEIHRVDTYGQTKAGMIPIFLMPEYESVEKFLKENQWEDKERGQTVARQIAAELTRFAKRTFAKRILCTDFTLADTFFPGGDGEPLEFLKAQDKAEDTPGLFVGDFGSYMESLSFQRGGSVIREQYRPPEDLDANLPFEQEPYLVYLLGLLLVEVYGLAPGLTLESVMQVHMGLEEADYANRVRQELEDYLSDTPKETVDQLIAMLAYQPGDRPSLQEI